MTKDDIKKIDYTRKKIEKAQAEFEKMKSGQIDVDRERFHFWKPDIEMLFVELEIIMTGIMPQMATTPTT